MRQKDLPCDVVCTDSHVVETPKDTLVPFESVLVKIYRTTEVGRSIRGVLDDLADLITLNSRVKNHIPGSGLLIPAIEKEGFRIVHSIRHQDEILTELCWLAKNTTSFHAGNWRFKMGRDKIVTCSWVAPQGDVGVATLLADELRKLFPGHPDTLLTSKGIHHLTSLQNSDVL